jgi:membrane-associated phospholipid phosphatase
VIVLLKVYDYVRSFADERMGPALAHGHDVLSVERALHLDFEFAANKWLTGHHALSLASAYWYQFAHIGFTMAILCWCYASGPELYRAARNALVITNLVGMTVFFFLPVMPPRLLPGMGYVDSVADAGFGTSHYGEHVPADQFAAMPSLHLAWATWTALVAVALLRRYRWGWLALIYPVITCTVVVVTANHYFLDGVAGVAVAMSAIWFSGLHRTPAQMIFRRSSTANTTAPGSNGSQTVSRRYPSTAATATALSTPTTYSPETSATSSPPTPPGEGRNEAIEDITT